MSYSSEFTRLNLTGRIGFCPFAVLGDPTPALCLKRIKKYLEARPDFLELGIPFSDPTADGSVIQAANARALKNGMTPKKAIALVRKVRLLSLRVPQSGTKQSRLDGFADARHDNVPIGILTYSNIVLHYDIDRFYRDLAAAGANSILIADVPLEEIAPFAAAARRYCLHQIFLVSEYTDTTRLKKIEKIARSCGQDRSGGFLYVVSTLGVTGTRKTLDPKALALIKSLKKKTEIPLMVGFGISNRQHIEALQKAGADGAIVGSALVKTPMKKLHLILNQFSKALSTKHTL